MKFGTKGQIEKNQHEGSFPIIFLTFGSVCSFSLVNCPRVVLPFVRNSGLEKSVNFRTIETLTIELNLS